MYYSYNTLLPSLLCMPRIGCSQTRTRTIVLGTSSVTDPETERAKTEVTALEKFEEYSSDPKCLSW